MEKTKRCTKSHVHERGEWKLGVFFHAHRSRDGKAYYFHSNRSQDRRGVSKDRLKQLVTDRWRGKVAWAGLYHQEQLLSEYKSETGEWETV